ncbi:hypothetical protein CYY_006314 [Polysphondylium violaceum]|uniref:N-acetyltransferase domain-containing protein n=1 Tax=Polysphondylium violaceum TaxID=133409 RepID=A0A8J4PRJ8_9MYCE|nr:hypothetical protein CYY_006314 [Polysphondylium violaceum]
MSGEIIIRNATQDEMKIVGELYTRGWQRTYPGLVPQEYLDSMSCEKSAKRFKEYMNTQGQGILVAVDYNDVPVGFTAYCMDEGIEDCVLLDSLHVSPSHQSKGIGKKLIFALGQLARVKGHSRMSISVVDGNTRARDIYQHLGAVYVLSYQHTLDERFTAPSKTYVWNDLNVFN